MKKQILIVSLISIWVFIFLLFTKVVKAERFEDRSQTFKTIDAAVEWDNGKAYFFKGGQYVRYDMKTDRVDPGYPKLINNETWPGLTFVNGIDAAVNWGNGKAYFFKGGQYIRYDIRSDRADPGYPKPINNETWSGIPWTDGIDAVVNWYNGKAYFFKGGQYIRYDVKTDRADPGYPKSINNETWPGLPWTDGIDTAVNWKNGKAYFFKGSQYIRYDVKSDRADPGYPKPINNETWPGLMSLFDKFSQPLLRPSSEPYQKPPSNVIPVKQALTSEEYQGLTFTFVQNILDGKYSQALALTSQKFRESVTEKELEVFRSSVLSNGSSEFIPVGCRRTPDGTIASLGLFKFSNGNAVDVHCLFQGDKIVYFYGR